MVKFIAKNITAVDASADDGTAMVTLKGDLGRTLNLRVSVDMLLEAASFAQKERLRRGNIAQYGEEQTKGAWHENILAAPTKWAVGTVPMFEPPAVSLVFDAGTKWQIGYRLGPADADKIGEALVAQSAKVKSPGAAH